MSTLTRHQRPKLRLSFAWKFILALVFLFLLLMFKDIFYSLEKNEHEQTGQILNVVQSAENSPVSETPPSAINTEITQAAPTNTPPAVIGKIKITPTPTGFLNVRAAPSSTARIITQASPGSIFSYTALQNGWYNIILPSNQTGWVSSQFAATD